MTSNPSDRFGPNEIRTLFIQQYRVSDEDALGIQIVSNERFDAMMRATLAKYSISSATTELNDNGKIVKEGAYAAVWRRMKESFAVSVSPFIASPFSPALPFISFESSQDWLSTYSRDRRGGTPSIAIAISALNFILREQHEIAKSVLQNKAPALRLLSQKTGHGHYGGGH